MAGSISRAAVFARAAVVEVDFVNFRFNPTVLKVCKIAGAPELLGAEFTFDVALVSPVSQPGGVPLFPPFTQAVTVTAGSAAQGGNCTFVNGSALPGGAFNQGSTVTITERLLATSTVTAITCTSCGTGGLTVDLPNRRGTLSGPNGLVEGINAVTFTNGLPTGGGTTAGGALLSGRVSDTNGKALSRVAVSLSGSDGIVRMASTNRNGLYRFDDVPVGQTYILSAAHKSFVFAPRTINLFDDLAEVDLRPEGLTGN
jgi:hypothetical protein